MSSPVAQNVGQWGETNNKRRMVLAWAGAKGAMCKDTLGCVAAFLGEKDHGDEARELEQVRLATWISGQNATWMTTAALESRARAASSYNTLSSRDGGSENGLSGSSDSSAASTPTTTALSPVRPRYLTLKEDMLEMKRGPRTRGPKPRWMM